MKIKKITKQMIALFSCLMLMTGLLSGCGKHTETESDVLAGQPEKGRYVETAVELPGEWAGCSIVQLFKTDGALHVLLSRKTEIQWNAGTTGVGTTDAGTTGAGTTGVGTTDTGATDAGAAVAGTTDNAAAYMASLEEWTYSEEGFFNVTGEWLKNVQIPYNEYGSPKLLQDAQGTQYLYACYEADEDNYQGHLWKQDGENAVDITPEKWTVLDEEWGIYEYPNEIVMLDKQIMMTLSYRFMDSILPEDGSIVDSQEINGYYASGMVANGDNFYLMTQDDMGQVNSVECWQQGKTAPENTISFSQDKSGSCYMSTLADGSIVIADGDGFFKCKAGDTNWQKLIEGADTSFALSNSWCRGMVALDDGSFYALFNSEGAQPQLLQYRFDPEAVNEITEVINIYSVKESFLLQQAAVMYHKTHPSVQVNVETATKREDFYGGTVDYQQIYQNLNTALMSGNAADILVMDGLQVESFDEKGLLTDISDVIDPMSQNGELLQNITDSYRKEDGSIGLVPLQFGFTMAVGRNIEEQNMQSLASLAQFLSGKSESYMGSMLTEELVNTFYPYFAEDIVTDEKTLDKEALAKNLEYLKQIADNSGIVEKRAADEYAYGVWDLASRAQLAVLEVTGFNDAMFPLSVANLIQGQYTSFEQTFTPIYTMGIYSKSEHQETAKDFLKFALSQTIQDIDYYEGFPVNAVSLELMAVADRSNAEAYTSIEVGDGAYEDFAIKCYSKEEADKLVSLCKSLNKSIKTDDKICEELINALPGYLNGSQSLEDTVSKIDDGLRIYLAE